MTPKPKAPRARPSRALTSSKTRKRHRAADTARWVADGLANLRFREQLHAAFDPLCTAAIEAARGLRHLYAKDATGQWTRVTDPDAIAARLNDPARDGQVVISQQDPDARLLEGLLVFMLGAPFEPDWYPRLVEAVTLHPETGEMSVELNTDLLAAVKRPSADPEARACGLPWPVPAPTESTRRH